MKRREMFRRLKKSTLVTYRYSPLLERLSDRTPFYFHIASCQISCKGTCNGQKGFDIAYQIMEPMGGIE